MQGFPLSESVPAELASPRGHEVVILRESEGEDISASVRRIRADAATARSQILIIAPDVGGGTTDREVGVGLASVAARARATAEAAAARALAQRFAPLVADLEQLLGESEREVGGLAEEVGEGTRARLQHRARVLGEISTWTRAVLGDLSSLVQAATAGRIQVDLAELWQQAVAELGDDPGVRFVLEPGSVTARPELEVAATLDLLIGCARLLAARLGHAGIVRVQVARTPTAVTLTLSGLGAARPVRATELVRRVREMAAAQRVTLTPGANRGVHGTTLELGFALPTG